MSQKDEIDLFQGEKIDVVTKPHPMSFLRYHIFSIYLIVIAVFLGWFYSYLNSDQSILQMLDFLNVFANRLGLNPSDIILLIIFWILLLLSGFGIGVIWITKMPLLYLVLIGTAGTTLEIYFLASYNMILGIIQKSLVKLLLLGIASSIGMILTEVYRKAHVYIITNYRIVMKKKFIRNEERELMFDKVTDVYVNQGILGKIFNYGTVVPISASGFGLGMDSSQAFAATTLPIKKAKISGGVAGGKSVQRPRSATYFSLFGVHDPRRIRIIIGNRQLETKESPILRRIENLLQDKHLEDN